MEVNIREPGLQGLEKNLSQYKSNVNFYSQRVRGLMQEKMVSHFFDLEHIGSIHDTYVQMIDHCDLNDKEKKKNHLGLCIHMD